MHNQGKTEDTYHQDHSPNQETAVMAEVGRLISSTFEIEDTYGQLAAEIQKLISFDRLAFIFVNRCEGTCTVKYEAGFDIPERSVGRAYPLKGSITNYLIKNRSGIIVHADNLGDLARQCPEIAVNYSVQRGARSLISIPLIVHDEVIGVMHIRSKKPRCYTEHDLQLAEMIGRQISGAIATAHLYAGLVKEAEIIAEIGRKVSSTLNIEEVFKRLAAESRKLISYDRILVTFLSENARDPQFTVAFSGGDALSCRKSGNSFPVAGSVGQTVMDRRAGIMIQASDKNGLTRTCPYVDVAGAAKMGILSLMCVPLMTNGEAIGILHFRSKKPMAYTERDLRLAEGIGRQVAGAVVNARFHSKLAAVQEAVAAHEMRLQAIFDQAAVGVAEVEYKTGRFLLVNQRFCEITGLTEAEMLATTCLAITHPEDRHVHEEGMRSLTAGSIRNFTIEERHVKKNGEPIWVSLTISALWKPGDPPGNHLCVVQDISRQKEAENALGRSEIKYRTLFESANDHIFVLRPDKQQGSIIVDANRAAIERYGNSLEELVGRPIRELSTPAYRKKRPEIIRALSKPGDKLVFEAERVGKDKQAFPVELSSHVVQIPPDPPFILAIERDVTERSRIMAELNRSKEAAERLAKEAAIIAEIGRKISSTLNIDEVYERLAFEAGKLISYDRLAVNRIDRQEGIVTVNYVAGLIIPMRRAGDTFRLAGSMTEAAAREQAGIILQASDENEIVKRCPYNSVMRQGVLSLMCIPLIWNDTVIGGLNFRSKKPNAYTEQDLRLAEGIGREIAGAIINAELYTDLWKTEDALRQSEEIYARLIEAMPDAVVQMDSDGGIVFANEVALKMFGIKSVADLKERDVLNFVAPADRARAAEDMRLMKTNRLGPQPYRLMAEAGRQIDAEINANVLYSDDKVPFGNVLLCRDVTERKRIEAALLASEANYRFLADNMNDMIWTLDLNLCTTYVNKSVEKNLGYRIEEYMGRAFSEKCTPESYARIREMAAEQRKIEKSGSGNPNRVVTVETEYYHKDGSTVWMESVVGGLRDDHGALVGYHGVSRNITERKKLEQRLRQLLDDLEHRVQERTTELEEVNTALRVMIKKGEQDLKNMEHDIRDNLDRLVLPFLRKLKMSASTEQDKTFANLIEMNLMNIVSPFINQLSSSYKNLTPKEIQIATLIRDGKSSKEIAEIIGVSVGTVVTHRNNIRKKLKLSSREVNLRSHLLSL
jgi:PAS domain S-box-containing protein